VRGKGVKIIIDTREKLPFKFCHKTISEVKVRTLKCGDYGCEWESGQICNVVFERKSVADLYGTLSSGYARFKKELERAKKHDITLILIVEGSLTEILDGYPYSERAPQSLLQQLFTLLIKYDLHFVFCATREEAARWIVEYFAAVGRCKTLPENNC
jgi:ERCC4-type nuclease